MPNVSLIALDTDLHVAPLQRVYELTPGFWDLYGLLGAPEGQGERDLKAIEEEEGRYGMGILLPNEPGNPEAGAQLVGLIDFRLQWPERGVCYVGMLMVAEAYQRQGIGSKAWETLEPWLANDAQMHTVRLGVEQFNPNALKFFESIGFQLTGQSARVRSGKRLVRLLYMEKTLNRESAGR